MTLDEALEIIKNAKPIVKPTGNTVDIKSKQENNSFKDIMKKWQKK